MATYAYIHASEDDAALRARVAELARTAQKRLGGPLVRVFVDSNLADTKTAIPERPDGRALAAKLQPGDTLLIRSLDRLGASVQAVDQTMKALSRRGVRLYVLHARKGELDLSPQVNETICSVFDVHREVQRNLRSEILTESARRRKEAGLACGRAPIGKKIVVRKGVKHLEWDMRELAIIAELATRAPAEGVPAVAEDFWRRGIKDRNGRLWGKPRPRLNAKRREVLNLLTAMANGHAATQDTPYRTFYRKLQWFHRMKQEGLLPPPYAERAQTIPEPKGFQEQRKRRGWTPGGTARRERERAAAKAANRAKRSARWQAEKEARLQKRVRKSPLAKLGLAAIEADPSTTESRRGC